MFANRSSARRLALVSSLMSALLAATVPAAAQTAAPAASAPAGPTVRPEVGNPLTAAQALVRSNQGKEALAKIAEAEAAPNPTPYEQHSINHTKAVAALAAGDSAQSLLLFEKVLGSRFLPEKDRLPITESTARLAIQTKNHPKALAQLKSYKSQGGADAALLRAYAQLLAEANDFAGAAAEAKAQIQAEEAAGRKPPESLYRILGFSQQKQADNTGYVQTLEKLVQTYPTPDYWADLVSRTVRKPGFADDRLRLDVYRLQRALGVALQGDEIADMAQRAVQIGLPAEAQKLLDEGYAAGLLGKGKDAAAHAKLREQATKVAAQDQKTFGDSEAAAQKAKDGNALVNLGVALAGTGAYDRAATLIEQGISRGGLRRPEEATLHLGWVQWRAGRADDALRSFAAVKGGDEGTADLARLWGYHLRNSGAKKS
ncbi:hypothetical protein HLB44_20270 [Aquincola sp. S2]|uniref:Tetratricopeptide repeat protein n=1 Tax=Pseudaquabacterium terrae TaxID=2732868 RepID=A0ABX2EL53_9BURK|nr:hypothetical protein [Aquabacterium terrae]NRF69338.1 hypothetical protein [Aquabacterium terrae]